MLYVNICVCVILYMVWSYLFIKTYQLTGYRIKLFLTNIFELNLAYGDKNKLVLTKRLCRFVLALAIVAIGLFFLVNYFVHNVFLRIFDCALLFLLVPFVIAGVHYLLWPIEKLIKIMYVKRAKRKLGRLDIIKIGITGSYGKTSTKTILATMLEKEYKVCATPKSYNTEMGVTKTILSNLDDHDVFIAEMGARHRGDIETLTKLVKPSYGILTTIGNQHIETFGSTRCIEETKNELPQNMPDDGVMVFNGDSQSTRRLYDRYSGEKYLTNSKDGYAYAENVVIGPSGSKFDLVLNGARLPVKTRLLGNCNIHNIVTAAAMASRLGITNQDLASAIAMLEPVPHRLEIVKNNFSTIIDDSYNCNIVGSSEALDVLSRFEGLKIVVTPGIVEMGKEQSDVNFKLGAMIADVADYIIIMNDTNKNYILSGAISHNFPREKIYFAQTRKKQKEILQLIMVKGAVVLFENDLPDNYR